MVKPVPKINGGDAEQLSIDDLARRQTELEAEQEHARKSRGKMHGQFEEIRGYLRDGQKRMSGIEDAVRETRERQQGFEDKVERELMAPLRPVTEIFADIGHVYPVFKRWGKRVTRVVVWVGSLAGAAWMIYRAGVVFGYWA